jgi:hypothetical protein
MIAILLTAFLALPAAAGPARGRRVPTEADEVKAVFLLNFTKFVEWPPEAFATLQSPIVIAVLGADPFDGVLDQAVAGETVNGRPIEVKRFKDLEALGPCHILFISASQEERVPEILRRLRRVRTLTVADMDGFAARGGAIQFRAESGRMRFEISQEAAELAGLRVSARLLRLASAVRPRRP